MQFKLLIETIQKWILSILWLLLPSYSIPRHIAIIMDGNRRYARAMKYKFVTEGHRDGFEKMVQVIRWCRQVGVKEISVYAFSLENFNRPQEEVDGLMNLGREKFQDMLLQKDLLVQTGVKIRVIGQISALPEDLQQIISEVEQVSSYNLNFTLNVCVAYLSTEEILHAINSSITSEKIISPEKGVELINKNLYTGNSPFPNLILRTSGEHRLSNFFLWQCSKSQLSFQDILWPDFTWIHFLFMILAFHFNFRALKKLTA